MKAMIFAAGLGTRLRPLTERCPKALVPVAGRPMLERVIRRLVQAGFDELVVNIHHRGEQIVEYLESHPFPGATLHISDERDMLLDTGGGIRKARRWLEGDEPFLIHNVDILCDIDLRDFYRRHLNSGAEASLLVGQRATSRYLLFDQGNRLCGWTNTATGETLPPGTDPAAFRPMAFGGIHVFSPSLFRRMEAGGWQGRFSIIPFYLSVCGEACIRGEEARGTYWFDIGKIDTLHQAEAHLARKGGAGAP